MLKGDTNATQLGSAPTYYTFSSGNSQDFIIVRKLHGQAKYLITASAQRLSNAPGAGDLVRTISFRLHDNNVNILNPITLDARLQGSTYILDLSQPGDTTFHQLDHWHEWKEPSHWCRDFEFDAEVWDSANAALTIRTDQRPGATVGDYHGFTSYIQFPTTTAQAQYQFQTRGPDQDSLYLWVRARNHGASANVLARLGTGAQQSLPIAPGGWAWYGRTVANQPIRFSTLADSVAYLLGIQVGSTQIEIDRVALKRSPADFSNQPFTVSATATASGCIGDSIQFAAGGLQPDGCVDYAWDFGDGGESYVANPAHMYQHPGTYSVVLSVTHGCLGLTLSDTVTVTINAPLVDAGPDRFACPGVATQLTGASTNATSFQWRPNPALNSTTVIHPSVTLGNSQYFYLEGTDNTSGCSTKDSVWVTKVAVTNLSFVDSFYVCPGQQVQLNVTGAFRVLWDPHPGLTVVNSSGRANVIPSFTQHYRFLAIDVCACDTVIDSILVVVPSIQRSQDTVCYGDTLTLSASGHTANGFLWSPGGATTPSIQVVGISNQQYILTINTTNSCGTVTDTMVVYVDSTAFGSSVLQSAVGFCAGEPVQLPGVPGFASYDWSPSMGLSATNVQSPFATISSPVTYSLTATSINGCDATGTVTMVQDLTTPSAQVLTPDTLICGTWSVQLQGTGAGSYLWTPSGATSSTPTVTPTANTTYTLTVNDGGACVGRDSVRVDLYACCMQTALPYAFLNARASDIVAVFGSNVVNQSISLNGTTLIDVPLTVTGPGTHVYMGDSALIEVQPGDSLVLKDQASIEAGCGEMWMAIELDGPTARLVTRDSATIRDGIDAVRSVGGGVFDIRDSRLLNNRRGIVVLPFANPHAGKVTGTRFQHTGGLLPPYAGAKAFAGIDANGVKGLTIGSAGAPYNQFGGMFNGVYARDTRLDLAHNRFAFTGGIGTGVNAASSSGQPAGGSWITVGAASGTTPAALAEWENVFSGSQYGLRLDDPGKAVIRGNAFSGISLAAVHAKRTDGDSVRVERNTFTDNAVAVFVGHALNSPGSVRHNQITGDTTVLRRGIRFDLLSYTGQPAGAFPMQVQDNLIDLRGSGVIVWTSDHVNVENNDIRLIRGANAIEVHYGVQVDASHDVRVANNQKLRSLGSGAANIRTIGIHVRTSPASIVNCNTLSYLGRHAVFQGPSQPSDFLGNSMAHGVDGFVLANLGRIGEQGNAFANRPSDNYWTGTFTNSWTHAAGSVGNNSRFFVRNHLPYLPPTAMNVVSGVGPSPMTPTTVLFTNHEPVQCYNTLPAYSVKGGIKSIAKERVPAGDFQQEDQFRIDEWAYATLLVNPSLLVDEPELQGYSDDMQATPLATAVKAQLELLEADSSKAVDYTAQLSLDIPAEANHRRVMEIRLDGPAIDSVELAALLAIAAQCERAGGKGVNLARGLLAAEGVMVWDDPDCPAAGKAAQADAPGAGEVQARCWPNPTDGLLHIDFSVADQQGRIKVFDALGQLLEERNFDYQDAPIILDGGRWPQGLLLVVAEMTDGGRHAWRILLRQ